MWEAIMQSSFMRVVITCLDTFMTTIIIFAITGLVGFACGELFPRRWVRYNKFPYNQYRWENGGRIYMKLKVNKWKDKVPDMSVIFKGMFPKSSIAQSRTTEYFEKFVIETCVAEAVHIGLMIGAFMVLFVFQNAWGLIASLLYAAGNLPFVLIQRYNRPRFKLLMERQKLIDAQKRKSAMAGEEI